MDKLFQDANFKIRITDDGVLSTKSMIFLKLDYKCACYEVREPKNAEFIKVQKTTLGPIMISDAIEAMIDYGVDPDCKHYTLDGFVKNTDVQFTPIFVL